MGYSTLAVSAFSTNKKNGFGVGIWGPLRIMWVQQSMLAPGQYSVILSVPDM